MSLHEEWNIAEVAEFLGYTGERATGSARRQLSRWGVRAIGYARNEQTSRVEGRYAAAAVRAARERAAGQGARSDLRAVDPVGVEELNRHFGWAGSSPTVQRYVERGE